MTSLLVFRLDDWKCALPLAAVERSYRAVAVTPLPGAPEKVMGIVNVHGVVHPVIDFRHCFGLPTRPLSPADHLIIGRTWRRSVALVVDSVEGVFDYALAEIADAATILPDMAYVSGIVRMPDGMVLIHDLDRFLSLEEETLLDQALET
ncbi:MAG: chemotaxis protein CheW [Methylocystis sp.]|uniref:chemotaxis protein CheW n=1 Tax=Methylocystis sp. TaxID=1911079 RepID=UPI003DA6671A